MKVVFEATLAEVNEIRKQKPSDPMAALTPGQGQAKPEITVEGIENYKKELEGTLKKTFGLKGSDTLIINITG